MPQKRWIDWLLFVLLSLIWGSSFILMKVSTEHLSGWQIGGLRILAAGLVFLPFVPWHLRGIPARKLPLVALSGLLGNLFPAFLFAIAIERQMATSLAGILNSLTPLFVIVLGVAFFKLKVPTRKVIGVLIGFAGLVVLSLSRGRPTVDDLGFTGLVLLATLFYGLNVNIVSRYLQGVDPFRMATVSLAFMAIPAAFVLHRHHLFSMLQHDEGARLSMAAAALLGVIGSALATALFYVLIRRAGGLFASLVTYGIPVVAIGWGLWAREPVTLQQVGCLGIILGGVYLANSKKADS